jgi:hypothetical protein
MDENVSGLRLADILNAYGEQYGCTFVTFPAAAHKGALTKTCRASQGN